MKRDPATVSTHDTGLGCLYATKGVWKEKKKEKKKKSKFEPCRYEMLEQMVRRDEWQPLAGCLKC